jgi:hypothetical protein
MVHPQHHASLQKHNYVELMKGSTLSESPVTSSLTFPKSTLLSRIPPSICSGSSSALFAYNLKYIRLFVHPRVLHLAYQVKNSTSHTKSKCMSMPKLDTDTDLMNCREISTIAISR